MLKLWRLYSRFTESLHHPELLLMLGSRDLKRLRKKTRWKEGLPQPQMIKTSCRWGIWWKWIAEKQSTPSLFQSWPKIEVSVSFFRSVNARFAVPARFAAFPFPHAHTGRHLGQRYTAITHGQTSDTQYRDIFSKCRLSVFKRGGLVGIDKLVASHSVERDTRLNRYD